MTYKKVILASFISIFFFENPAWADQLIIEPEMGRKPIIHAIKSARHSLKVVMYGFTDESLLIPILKQKAQGRTVKIILERKPYKAENENDKTIIRLNDNQVDWLGNIPSFQHIHQKTLIIDGKTAIVMTFNFTKSAFKNERNFALILDNPKEVKEIESSFDSDWNQKPSNNHFSSLIWSPENSRVQLLALIKQAKQSITIYAQNVNDYKIVGALAKAAKKGVSIKILTSAKIRQKQNEYLARAGVKVRRSEHYYIHAKALIIDNQIAVIGSINLTRASLDDNRELAAITHNAEIIKQLNATFESDWSEKNLSKSN